MKHLALVGFMAAGKSTVGKVLAARIGWEFVDTDALVEREHGRIADIFAREGEARFREYERDAVKRAVERTERSVIAVGGGAVTHEATRDLLAERTFRVFLQVSEDEIERRLRRARTRPLLGSKPSAEVIAATYRQRLPLYRESELVVDCARLDAPSTACLIDERLREDGFLR